MSQSSVIAAALIAGFVLYLASQNRLQSYASVLWGASGTSGGSSGSGGSSSGGSKGITSDPTSFSNDSQIFFKSAEFVAKAFVF